MKDLKSKHILILVFLFVLVLILAVYYFFFARRSPEEIADAVELIEEAQLYSDESRFAESMELYYEAMAKDQSNCETYLGIADIYIEKNRNSDAIDILEQGLLYSKDKYKINKLLGQIFVELGDIDEAISQFSLALDRSAGDETRLLLAYAYIKISDFESAMNYLEDISSNSDNIYINALLLKAVLTEDDLDKSLNYLRTAEALEPSDRELASNIKNYIEKIQIIKDLDEDQKSDKYVDVLLAKAALDVGLEDVTIAKLQDYISDESEYWELYLYLGQAYYLKSDYEKAEGYLLKAYDLNPINSSISWILARIYYLNNRMSQAEEFYLRAIEMSNDEDEIEIRSEYAEILVEDEQYLSAEEQYEMLINLDSESNYKYLILIAEASVQREEYENARDQIKDLSLDDMSEFWISKYYWLRGYLELEAGNREDAKEWALKAVDVDRTSARNYLLLGQIEFDSGENAESNLKKAIDLDTSGVVSVEAMQILDRI